MKPFPIYLNNLSAARSIVIGGGHEAERKTGDLLQCDANVTVISPEVSEQLGAWADEEVIRWIRRDYQRGDLEDAFLVIISETNPQRTRPIWEEAQEKNVLINAMDDVPHCNFVSGSVVRRGPLVLSISTSGCAPTLSVRLRQRMEDEFGPEYASFLHIMRALRAPMAAHYPDFEERRRRWYEVVDSNVLDHLREGRLQQAHERIAALVGESVAAEARVSLRADRPDLPTPARAL